MAEGGSADPLANGRVTMLGPCTRVGEDGGRARAAFFAAHPNSTYYADFRDFTFWKLHVDYVRYIGGYGRMSWISQADWRAAEPDPLAPSAADIIASYERRPRGRLAALLQGLVSMGPRSPPRK